MQFRQRTGMLLCVLSGMILGSVFLGCSSVQPVVSSIIDDVGGTAESTKFQYYLSTRIVLSEAEALSERQIDTKYGRAKIKDTVKKNKIRISNWTMGALLKSYTDTDGRLIFEVCFEDDDNKVIKFKQGGAGTDRRFYLEFSDSVKPIIQYGGISYSVKYSSLQKPYLQIKLQKKLKEQVKTRWAKGRRI